MKVGSDPCYCKVEQIISHIQRYNGIQTSCQSFFGAEVLDFHLTLKGPIPSLKKLKRCVLFIYINEYTL